MKYKQAEWRIERNQNILKDKLAGMKTQDIANKYFLTRDAINYVLASIRGRTRKMVHLEFCPNHPHKKNIRGHNLCEECFKQYHSKKSAECQRRKKEKEGWVNFHRDYHKIYLTFQSLINEGETQKAAKLKIASELSLKRGTINYYVFKGKQLQNQTI